MSADRETELLLREGLRSVADEVRTPPQAYRRAQAEWRRRERRRRMLVVVLALLAMAGAGAVALWALHGTEPHAPVVVGAPAPWR